MELSQLEILLDVVRRGSFAAAARARRVDPSSISRAVSSLEAELGLRLLHRTTRRLTLTEVGRRYVEQVEPLVAGLEDAVRLARDAQRSPSGRVAGTVPVSFALECIVPTLPSLRQALPDISLDLLMTDARLDLVQAGVDFAIRLGRVQDPDLVVRRLLSVRYRCVASADYLRHNPTPKSPSDLRDHPALRFPLSDVGPVWRFRDLDGEVTQVPVSGPLVLSNTLALRQATRAGLGVSVLPSWLVDKDLASGTLVALCVDHQVTLSTFDAGVYLVYPNRRYIPAAVRAVVEHLARHLTALDAR